MWEIICKGNKNDINNELYLMLNHNIRNNVETKYWEKNFNLCLKEMMETV